VADGLDSVASSKRCLGLDSYSFLIRSIVARRRLSLSDSIYSRVSFFKCLGTGFASTILLITSGRGIILGLIAVRLKGLGFVTLLCFFCGVSSAGVFKS